MALNLQLSELRDRATRALERWPADEVLGKLKAVLGPTEFSVTEPLVQQAMRFLRAGETPSPDQLAALENILRHLTNLTASITPQTMPASFASLAALRAAHMELLASTTRQTMFAEQVARITAFLRAIAQTGAVLQSRSDRSATQGLLDYWLGVLYAAAPQGGSKGIDIPDEPELAPFDPSTSPELDDKQCPFIGLASFLESDSERFYGRDEAVETLIEKVRRHPMVLVTGASGSGKSSLVLAGLLPGLKKSPDAGGWFYPPVTVPGNDPVANVLRAIIPQGRDPREWVTEHRPLVLADPAHLRKVVTVAAKGQPTVLVVDQFEELFTLCECSSDQTAYVEALVGLLRASPDLFDNRVILTVREDFLPDALRHPALRPLIEDPATRFNPAPMSARQLRRVIERPAAMVGLTFDEGIVDDLSKEVIGESTALPLLQFTLMRLWENRERNRISWDAYRRVGKPREALKCTADEVYAQLPQDLDRQVARLIFRELVQPAVGVEYVRRRPRRESLRRLAASVTVDNVLERFVNAGLLRMTRGQDFDDDRFEVAHEALLRNWPQLTTWLEADRAQYQQRLRLRAAAELCRDSGWDPGLMLSGPPLEDALRQPDLDPLVQEFVRRSQEAAAMALQERERARDLLLEQANRVAAAERARADEQNRRAEAERERAEAEGKRADAKRREVWLWRSVMVTLLLVSVVISLVIRHARQVQESANEIQIIATQKTEEAKISIERALVSEATTRSMTQEKEQLLQQLALFAERPAFPVCKDRIMSGAASGTWEKRLAGKDAETRRVIRSTGRLEVNGVPNVDKYVGSSFVVGHDVVLTTAFVADLFSTSDQRGGWRLRPGVSAAINFSADNCGSPSELFDITEVLYVGARVNGGVALLKTKPLGPDHPSLPMAHAAPSSPLTGKFVYTVGYPANDSRLPEAVLALILGEASGVKRLSPGAIIPSSSNDRIGNDCTTMGGSGGGPLVDLESGVVIGVSHSGQLVGTKVNSALQIWTILQDPKIREILDRENNAR